MDDVVLDEEINAMINEAHKFYKMRYQMSNGGNLSIRIPNKDLMIVKGTNVSFEDLSKQNIVVTDFDGNVVEGSVKPSKEALLHGALYKKLPEVSAIMHCHSLCAVAWAANHDELLFSTYHSSMKLHEYVPVFDTHSYAVPQSEFPRILSSFNEHPDMNAFLLRGHGQVTMASNIKQAAYLAEMVEETAQIAILGKIASMS